MEIAKVSANVSSPPVSGSEAFSKEDTRVFRFGFFPSDTLVIAFEIHYSSQLNE